MKFLAILAVVFNLQNCLSFNLNCSFKEYQSFWDKRENKKLNTNGTRYTCIAENLATSLLDRTVINLMGNHSKGKSDDDVKQVFVNKQNCPYLPLGVGKFFKNLEIFYVMNSKVEQLTNDDLSGMPKLKIFDMSHNPITNLTRDFFQGHSTIEMISFYKCELTFIETGALDSLVNLKEVFLGKNLCVDYNANEKSKIVEVEQAMEKCRYEKPTTESGNSTKKSSITLVIGLALTGLILFLKAGTH